MRWDGTGQYMIRIGYYNTRHGKKATELMCSVISYQWKSTFLRYENPYRSVIYTYPKQTILWMYWPFLLQYCVPHRYMHPGLQG